MESEAVVVSKKADVAQSVEHSLGKGEVTGSIPVISSRFRGFAVLSLSPSPGVPGFTLCFLVVWCCGVFAVGGQPPELCRRE
jgi:hypothetical protein